MGHLARGLSWKGIGQVVGDLTWYGSLVVLAALLPPSAFGIVAVAMVLVSVTRLLMESGTGGGIIVSGALTGSDLRALLLRNLLIAGCVTVGLAILAPAIVDTFAAGADPAVVRVMLVSVVLAALGIVPVALLDKTLRFKARAQLSIAAAVVSAVAAVAVAVVGGGVWALVTRQLVNQGLLTLLAWVAVRDVWPRGSWRRVRRRVPRTGGTWFLVMAAANFTAYSLDNLLVGSLVDLRDLGLYSLAFTLAFAPLTRISWVIGSVLFPSVAATTDMEQIRRRTLKSTRLMALLLWPWAPIAVALAPVLIPALLGERWRGMVVPFQIMLVVGVAHGVLNVLAETFSGSGNAGFRARVDALWAVGTVALVVVLTRRNGIQGAAVAHAAMFCVLAGFYVTRGLRRIGVAPGRFFDALRGMLLALAGQTAVTALAQWGLGSLGSSRATAGVGAALVSLAAGCSLVLVLERRALGEAREVLHAARRGEGVRGSTDR